MKYFTHINLLILLTLGATYSYGQDPTVNPLSQKTLTKPLPQDSFPPVEPPVFEQPVIVISPDSIDATVEYGSLDSNYFDNASHQVHLFGKAYVRYKDMSIQADYIVVDLDSSIASAEGRLDSVGQLTGNPEFKMGDESFSAKKMRYNFKTRKGIIYDALTKESDLFVHGDKAKFVAGGSAEQKDDILYGSGTLITTCDHPNPHFGIRANRIKTIPDKVAVIGSSHFEIFGVPTPIWLPFGFYPVSETRTAGVIFPRDFERSPQLGFGIREAGYYFPIKDWADVKILGDIYFNGTWGIGLAANYAQRYKFRGNLAVRYSYRITEPSNDYRENVEKSFSIRLSHNQDSKANPYQTIGGSINIQSNDYESLNYNDAQSVLTNTYSSNFNYSRIFPGKPYSLSASLNHSQNTQSHLVTINAPDVNFRLNRIYPFRSNKRPGPERWFENIAFQYSGNAKAQILATDTTLLDQATWDKAQWGAQHRASASLNFNVLEHFNFTPSVDYGETWFFKTQDRVFRFDPTDMDFVEQDIVYFPDSLGYIIVPDTVSYGVVDASLTPGFEAFRTISGGISMNTQVFGTLQFSKGWLRGFRHVMKPSIGFSFAPASPESYYEEEYFSIQYPDSTKRYSRFDNLLYSARPTDVKQANLNYSITNILEAKYFSKRDSTEKKLKLFDNISVGGSFNMARKKNQNPWSPINISGNTRFFKGITTFSIGATYSVYGLRPNGQLDTATYYQTTGHLLRFDNLRLRFSTHITFNDVKNIFTGPEELSQGSSAGRTPNGPKRLPDHQDKFEDLLSRFSINHELGVVRMGMQGPDTTFITTNSINMFGSMQVTPNWGLYFGNVGYDFQSKQLTYPDLGLTRDLHCWILQFTWQPTRGTYAFNIRVKPGTFDFLKFPYNRGNYDTSGGF